MQVRLCFVLPFNQVLFFFPVHIRSSFSWKKLLDNVYISPEVENPFKNILLNVLIAWAE